MLLLTKISVVTIFTDIFLKKKNINNSLLCVRFQSFSIK